MSWAAAVLRWLPVAEPLARAALSAVATKHDTKLPPAQARALADDAIKQLKAAAKR